MATLATLPAPPAAARPAAHPRHAWPLRQHPSDTPAGGVRLVSRERRDYTDREAEHSAGEEEIAMGVWIDEFARGMARGMSRRAALRRLAGGAAAVVLALGLPGRVSAGTEGTCPRFGRTENCRRGRSKDCRGADQCACVKRVDGGKACIERSCGPACASQSDCSAGEVCVDDPGCCMSGDRFCALPCGAGGPPMGTRQGGYR